MTFALDTHQVEAIKKLGNGKILIGGVGTGKSITALAYFTERAPKRRIVVITTAKKRDSGEWYADAMKMSLRTEMEVDSWNNIKKYEDCTDVSFIFDEQKLVGKGAWVQAFWNIAKRNEWILLSATPADTWMDLMPVFVANGFYRNQTDFNNQHVIWSRYARYPKVDRYMDPWILESHLRKVYVEMPYLKTAVRVDHIHEIDFSREEERLLYVDRWNFYEDQPIKDAGEMMRLMRKSANTDIARYNKVVELANEHPRLIVFYNHNPELELLRCLHSELDIPVAEWNGQNHQDIPSSERWIYLVQYEAGAEGWNCISTNQVVFFSLPYSYRRLEQGKGRVDRLNTPYAELHYHIFRSRAIIDQAIWKALTRKKNFNAASFARKTWPKMQSKPRPLN